VGQVSAEAGAPGGAEHWKRCRHRCTCREEIHCPTSLSRRLSALRCTTDVLSLQQTQLWLRGLGHAAVEEQMQRRVSRHQLIPCHLRCCCTCRGYQQHTHHKNGIMSGTPKACRSPDLPAGTGRTWTRPGGRTDVHQGGAPQEARCPRAVHRLCGVAHRL
jgi:hypothetical protein